MLSRIKAAIHSGQFLQRLAHFLVAQILFSFPQAMRKKLFYGTQHYCPVCDTNLKQFIVLHRDYHLWCPVCKTLQRHRLIWLFFVKMQLFTELPKRMLHIAPEPGLTARFLTISGLDYTSIDLYDSSAMIRMDITHIEYPDNSFDLIYCSHVLEHVIDDHKALIELQRVLCPKGRVIILVPITVEKTVEALTITDPVMRERLFGQFDHVRSYGRDFGERLEQAGFNCRIYKTEDIVQLEDIERLGLQADETIFMCEKHQ